MTWALKDSGLLSGVVLGVGGDVSTADILDGNVLDVETDIVTGVTLLELLVVHLDGLDFSGDVGRGEVDDHAGLDDTGLNTTDGHCANTTNFVDILKRKTEGLVGGTNRRLDGVDGVEEGLALDDTSFGLPRPSLVPGHAKMEGEYHDKIIDKKTYLADSSNMLSPCHPEMGTKATDLGL